MSAAEMAGVGRWRADGAGGTRYSGRQANRPHHNNRAGRRHACLTHVVLAGVFDRQAREGVHADGLVGRGGEGRGRGHGKEVGRLGGVQRQWREATAPRPEGGRGAAMLAWRGGLCSLLPVRPGLGACTIPSPPTLPPTRPAHLLHDGE